jgi:hypothetical protein
MKHPVFPPPSRALRGIWVPEDGKPPAKKAVLGKPGDGLRRLEGSRKTKNAKGKLNELE